MGIQSLSGAGLALQRIESSLHATLWRLDGPQPGGHAFVAIEDGTARIEGGAALSVDGPAIVWLAEAAGRRLRAEAGTTGYTGWVAADTLARTTAELAPALPWLAPSAPIVVPLPRPATAEDAPLETLDAMLRELRTPRLGADIVILALFRILLVSLLRLTGPAEPEATGSGSNARFLERFRELVEANFRTHWPVARYAAAIGISHDRLHAICTRILGRSPKALIAERLAREAGLALERSTLSLEQLSYALGFRDPAHFSHFFKRMTGVSPGAFRRRMSGTARDPQALSPVSFADWP